MTIYLAVCLVVYLFQRRLQYHPDDSPVTAPGGDRFQGLEDVEIPTADGRRLRGWYWPGSRPVTVVIFPGNAGNREYRLPILEGLHGKGLGACIFDYPGYGGSDGSPTESGIYSDIEGALAWLQERSPDRLVYLGESLGSGVAVEMAVRRPPTALILQAAFPSALEVARSVYFFLPVTLLMRDRYESDKKISAVTCPVLSIHGNADQIIAPKFGRALHEAAPGPKEWFEVEGAGHNNLLWVAGETYFEAIDGFLERHVPSQETGRQG